MAAFMIAIRKGSYSSLGWNGLEYLSLFVIVLLHEFGHAMACRQTGGTANRILLWPLGGVAYVNPPKRPGANLWSTAAGPLVNLALLARSGRGGCVERLAGMGAYAAQCLPLSARSNVDRFVSAGVQHAANLSAGWRPDFSIAALVCNGARPQPDGDSDSGPGGNPGVHRPRAVFAVGLAGSHLCLHAVELLERNAASAGSVAHCKCAAQGRVCMP